VPKSEKGKKGFQREYNPLKILSVLLKTREKKTSVIKKDLCKVDNSYCKPTQKWYNENLQELEKRGLVERSIKELDPAYYWVITEAGIEELKKMKEED
jgi:DNA-binding HxlR family transcriptional regulator